MATPPFEFVFRVLGLKLPSATGREVTERLAILWAIDQERHEQAKQAQASNGQTAQAQ